MLPIDYNNISNSIKCINRKINSKKILKNKNYLKKKNYEEYFKNNL